MHNIKTLLPLVIIAIVIFACSPKAVVVTEEENIQNDNGDTVDKPTEEFLAYIDGVYAQAEFDKEPVPNIGKDEFYTEMYTTMKYPAEAREKGVQGSVVFEVLISNLGHVQKITKTQGLGYGCDEEAFKAIRKACMNGFEPGIINGEAVFTKYIVPVHFKLG